MFTREFSQAEMTCIIENIFEDGEWVILEWKDPLGIAWVLVFSGSLIIRIVFQRGYWDKLTFLKQHNLPIPRVVNLEERRYMHSEKIP
jgi:hypothetical protein